MIDESTLQIHMHEYFRHFNLNKLFVRNLLLYAINLDAMSLFAD